jgi:hypothetical protein
MSLRGTRDRHAEGSVCISLAAALVHGGRSEEAITASQRPRISYARPAANARRPKALRNHAGVAGEWGSDRLAGGQVPHLHRVVGAEDDHRASRSVASGRKVHSDGITASMDNPRRRGHPRIPPALASREHMDVPTRSEEPVMAGSIRKSLDFREETRWLSC